MFSKWQSGEEIDAESVKKEITDGLIKQAENITAKVVTATNQTFVNALKASDSFDSDKMKEAFSKSYSTVCALMSEEMENAIASTYGSVSVWLTTQIEAAVLELKSKALTVSTAELAAAGGLEIKTDGGDGNVGD